MLNLSDSISAFIAAAPNESIAKRIAVVFTPTRHSYHSLCPGLPTPCRRQPLASAFADHRSGDHRISLC